MIIAAVVALVLSFAWAATAQQPATDGPRYQNGTELLRPGNYREWIFLSSGLGMTYDLPVGSPPTGSPAGPRFGNVFVNPSSYRGFVQSGVWPNGTIFILEGRNSSSLDSINQNGHFQTNLTRLEAEVKDARFPSGWAYFTFGAAPNLADAAAPLAGDALKRGQCVECHTEHGAVERTFVQLYPTLIEIARLKRTLKPGF
jgi:hypothetical protein